VVAAKQVTKPTTAEHGAIPKKVQQKQPTVGTQESAAYYDNTPQYYLEEINLSISHIK
jgi:hypothetical protein